MLNITWLIYSGTSYMLHLIIFLPQKAICLRSFYKFTLIDRDLLFSDSILEHAILISLISSIFKWSSYLVCRKVGYDLSDPFVVRSLDEIRFGHAL